MTSGARSPLIGGFAVALALAAGFGAGAWRYGTWGAADAPETKPAELRPSAFGALSALPPASLAPEAKRPDNSPVVFGALSPFPSTQGGLVFVPREPPAAVEAALETTPAEPAIREIPGRGVPAAVPLPPPAPVRLSLDTPLPPARPSQLAALLPPVPREVTTVASYAPPSLSPGAPLAPDARPLPPSSGPFTKGSAAFVRIFKKEGELELWLKREGRYALFKTFPICKWSGKLGPKVKEGDYQSPEGFYSVTSRQLNPNSAYHLAFNVGFPNAYDRQNGRTGSALMVHGDCVSVGCFAMTNKGIEEIYTYVEAALRAGQRDVPVHIFPFRMTETAIARESGGTFFASLAASAPGVGHGSFWRNLKEGYDLFERTGEPPEAYACNKRYVFGASGANCTRIAGW